MPVTTTVDRTKAVLASIKALARSQVLVGVPSTTAEREPEPDDPAPLTNAEVGYIQENGAPEINLPARPFLKPGVEDEKDAIAARYEKGAKAVLDGRVANIDSIHEQVGLQAQNAVRAKLTDGPFAPLKDSTLANRRRRGRTGEKPLIDTGQLRNSITFVVRPKK